MSNARETMTPAGHARHAAAIRAARDLLDQWGAADTDTRARALVDAITNAGWHPPADLIRHPAPHARSTEAGRAAARQLYEQTRAQPSPDS